MKYSQYLILMFTCCFLTCNFATAQTNTFPNSGNVGIGTTSPSSQLHVLGNSIFQKDGSALNGISIENKNGNGHRRWSLWNFNDYWGKTGLSIHEYWDADEDGNNCDDGGYCASRFFIETGGNVGIGTQHPTNRLTVNGSAEAEEVIVTEDIGADFVFEEDYSLPALSVVEKYIKEHKHLSQIPSAEEMKKNGIRVGELQIKLLQKIEELTLYVIKLKKENTALIKRVEKLENTHN